MYWLTDGSAGRDADLKDVVRLDEVLLRHAAKLERLRRPRERGLRQRERGLGLIQRRRRLLPPRLQAIGIQTRERGSRIGGQGSKLPRLPQSAGQPPDEQLG